VTSCTPARLRRAVTRPRTPRRGTRSPSLSLRNVTGGRLETTMSFRRDPIARTLPQGPRAAGIRSGSRSRRRYERGLARVVPRQPVEERKPVAQQSRHEEVLPETRLAERVRTRAL